MAEATRTHRLTYRLVDGRLVSREYVLPESFSRESWLSVLLQTDPMILSNVYWLHLTEFIDSISLTPMLQLGGLSPSRPAYPSVGTSRNRNYADFVIFDPDEVASLVDALKKDYVYTQIEDLSYREWSGGSYPQFRVRVHMWPGIGLSQWNSLNLEYGEFTYMWLIDHGYEPFGGEWLPW